MSEGFESSNDISSDASSDMSSDVGSDTASDYGGDLAGDTGTDLNDGADGSVGDAVDTDVDGDAALGEDLNEKPVEDEIVNGEQSVESNLPDTNAGSDCDNTIDTPPDNRGAVPGTEKPDTILSPGTIGVRYGNPETGEFAAPYGTPREQLSIPPTNSGEQNIFVVTDPNGIPVTESTAAAANNQPGGGTQWDFGAGNPISGYDHRHYSDNKRGEH